MKDYGNAIKILRKRNQMTQSTLAVRLNISGQAISKWENNLAQPDFDTIVRLTEIFGVTLDEFSRLSDTGELEGVSAEKVTAPAEQKEQIAVSVSVPEASPAPKMLGICTRCGTAIYNEKAIGVRTPKFICASCKAAILKKKKEEEEQERLRLAILKERNAAFFKKSLWIPGAIIGGSILLLTMILPRLIGFYLLAGVLIYLAVVQIRWGNNTLSAIWDHSAGATFSMPGLIFTLDLEGILWLLTVKLGLSILSVLLSCVVTVLVFSLCMILAPFFFPFTLRRTIRDMKAGVLVE